MEDPELVHAGVVKDRSTSELVPVSCDVRFLLERSLLTQRQGHSLAGFWGYREMVCRATCGAGPGDLGVAPGVGFGRNGITWPKILSGPPANQLTSFAVWAGAAQQSRLGLAYIMWTPIVDLVSAQSDVGSGGPGAFTAWAALILAPAAAMLTFPVAGSICKVRVVPRCIQTSGEANISRFGLADLAGPSFKLRFIA